MKKKIMLVVAAAMTIAGNAQAADMYRTPYAPAPALVSAHAWMGPYVGVTLGYEWGQTTNSGTRPSGVLGGAQAGYNWQSGQFVFGGEADVQASGADDMFAPWKFANPWFSTIRGRAGIAMNNILFYGTLGFALGGIRADNIITGAQESKLHTGWTAGLGLEVGLVGNWSARAEYLYLDLAERGYAITGTNNGMHMNMLRLGVNYHF